MKRAALARMVLALSIATTAFAQGGAQPVSPPEPSRYSCLLVNPTQWESIPSTN